MGYRRKEMSYRIRVPSKSEPVTEPQLLSRMERLLLAMQENRRAVLVGIGVLLAAVALVTGVLWYDHHTAEAALDLYREATRHYLMRPADKPEQADANLKEAIKKFRQVVEQYPRAPSAPLALYHLGNALVQANELDAAIETYKRYVLLYGSNSALLGLVQQRLGYAYLLKGDRDQAAKAFETVLQLPSALNKDNALFELGKLEEAQSRPEGAVSHYQQLIKEYPTSPFASEAAVRIKALEVKKGPDGSASGSATAESQPSGSAANPAGHSSPSSGTVQR